MTGFPVRLGLVGAGAIGVRGVLEHLTLPDVHDLVSIEAICDPVPGRAEALAKQYGVPHVFTEYDALLASGTVDAVTLATPIGLHYSQGMEAIAAGIHVHFHKTMATTLAEANAIIDLAERQGVRIAASPGQMSMPHNRRIREIIEQGELGAVAWALVGESFGRYHESEVERLTGPGGASPAWYWRKPGGGPLYDMTVYGLHTLTGVLGPVKSVTAVSGQQVPVREFAGQAYDCDVDDNSFALLDFGGATFGVVYGSAFGNPLPIPGQPSIFGSKGSIVGTRWNDVDLVEEGVWPYTTGTYVTSEHASMPEAHVFDDLMGFVHYVGSGGRPYASAEHARHVIEIIELIYAAAESGERQHMTTGF